MRTLTTLLLAACLLVPTMGCAPQNPADPVDTALEVLDGVSTAAGASSLLEGLLARAGVPATWLDTPEACTARELIRQPAAEAANSIRISRATGDLGIVAGELNLLVCGGAQPQPLSPGAVLVISGAVDVVQGSMLLGRVDLKDPTNYGIGCGVLEWIRDGGVNVLREATARADGRAPWSLHRFDVEACRASVIARADAIGTPSPAPAAL